MKEMNLTSIPELIKRNGSMRATTRNTGIAPTTLLKYQHDYNCERHIIVNGQPMFMRETTPKLTQARPASQPRYEFINDQLVRVE